MVQARTAAFLPVLFCVILTRMICTLVMTLIGFPKTMMALNNPAPTGRIRKLLPQMTLLLLCQEAPVGKLSEYQNTFLPLIPPTSSLWSIGRGANAVGLSIYLGPVYPPNDRPFLPPSPRCTFCFGYWKRIGAVGLSIYLGPANLNKIDRQICHCGSVGLSISSGSTLSLSISKAPLSLISSQVMDYTHPQFLFCSQELIWKKSTPK